MITAGGIFLGIAFFTVVLTQSLMQWPVPQPVDAGYVHIDGQVQGPNDYEVWKPIPVQEGVAAGMSPELVQRVSGGNDTFQLALVVQGRLNAKEADREVARLKSESKALDKMKSKLSFFIDVMGGKDVKAKDAIKYGVPASVANKLADKKGIVDPIDLTDALRDDSFGIPGLFVAVALDQDISLREAEKVGLPASVAKLLAGEGKTFKALPLSDLISGLPDQIALWESRAAENRLFKTVGDNVIKKLDERYALTLKEAIAQARGFAPDARKANVMVVNKDRKLQVDFNASAGMADQVRLRDGDLVYVPDQNSYFRMWWLIAMSLLVCTVGITNSMLMAVTERFKEIGTMKCLGALDSFVVTLFMLESGMMGIVASVLGWIVGFASIVLIAGFSKGWDVVANIEMTKVFGTLGLAVVVGLVLTIIATIAPAMRAAGMPAAVALRSEV